jgi:hypothetical protein
LDVVEVRELEKTLEFRIPFGGKFHLIMIDGGFQSYIYYIKE